ncbi:hypothetical protein TRFO_20830 [Tritrichomonas foetus]|uniref:PH domain-containing protein n=1 Tax=Tritrichomonas foetus TaxID=1144522 RepID=A0A1J4KJM2_9EUKA|nr:hypothetical protein TRFO_20830 [Tritrichomonas foetus]|eukprot:OHT10028.1 hypothetical protein TRFO_20830 [Tritrichomonas foetus]
MDDFDLFHFLIPDVSASFYQQKAITEPDYIQPIICHAPSISTQELDQINQAPLKHFENFLSTFLGSDPTPEQIAQFLFFSGISPHAISIILFNSKNLSNTFLPYFFLAPVITFLPFVTAIRIEFSHIALPYSKIEFIALISALSKALIQNNNIEGFKQEAVSHLIMCCLFHSLSVYIQQPISISIFLDICNLCEELRKFGMMQMTYIYEKICEEPLIIYYSFVDPKYIPNTEKFDDLPVKHGYKKSWKTKHVIIDQNYLVIKSKYEKKKESERIKLDNIAFTTIPGKEFIFSIFPIHKSANEKLYSFMTRSKKQLETWRCSLLLRSFYRMLDNIIHESS